ncbi:MAG TPA: hypothetical protein VH257_21115 [Chloroflexota bacterium]|nr:hypothetical protein [Chloroflexota bacterium]
MRAGIFLLSLAGLLFQVALTRLASAALNYHLTFLAVGASVLGVGIGATWIACARPAGSGDRNGTLRRLALGAAAGMALIVAGFAWLPLGRSGGPGLLVLILLAYPALIAPYVCVGAAVTLALRSWPRQAGGLYGADLLGAGAGCLLAVPLMDALGPPLAAGTAAMAAAASASLLAPPRGGTALAGAAVAGLALLAGGAAGAPAGGAPNVLPGKPLAVLLDPARHPGAALLESRWDATSRVDVFSSPGAALLWAGPPHSPPAAPDAVDGARPGPDPEPPEPPELLGMTIDADALTAIARRRPGEQLAVSGRLPTSVAYAVAPRREVLVIGPGGGVDVGAALAFGATRVDAVEVNAGVARLVLGPLAAYGGDLFREPGVRLVLDEGRGYLHRTPRRYDAIVLTAVDSWAALASGAYSLAESYLYTSEAMDVYLDHLHEGGVLAVSRWLTAPPREMQRLAVMAGDSLRRRGESPDEGRLLLRAGGGAGGDEPVRWAGDFGTLLVRRGAFTPDEVQRAREFGAANGYQLATGSAAETLLASPGPLAPTLAPLRPGAPVCGPPPPTPRPATDDRPYFFDFLPWSSVWRGDLPETGLPLGHAVLLVALLQGLCLGVAGLVLPWRRLPAWCDSGRRLRLALYAGAAGLGFMLAEMALLQRLTLLLGQPGLSLAVALAGLLLGAGLGAATGARVGAGGWGPARLLLGAAGVLGLEAVALSLVWGPVLGWPAPGRIAVALGAGLLPGYLMGPALPAGAALLGRSDPAVVPWLWAVNGAASAAGAALAVMLAMEWGGRAVLLLAAALYVLLAVLLVSERALAPRSLARSTAVPL